MDLLDRFERTSADYTRLRKVLTNSSQTEHYSPITMSSNVIFSSTEFEDGTIVDVTLEDMERDFVSSLPQLLYPIGCVLPMTTREHPSIKLGGEWRLIGVDSTLIGYGIGPRQGNFNPQMITLPDGSVWDVIIYQDITTNAGFLPTDSLYDCEITQVGADGTSTLIAISKASYISNYYCTDTNNIELMLAYNIPYGATEIDPTVTARWIQSRPLDYRTVESGTQLGVTADVATNPSTDGTANTGCVIPTLLPSFTGLQVPGSTGEVFQCSSTYQVGMTYNANVIPSTQFQINSITLFARIDNQRWYCKTPGAIVGQNEVALTLNTIPNHTHKYGWTSEAGGGSNDWDYAHKSYGWTGYETGSAGSNAAHNNKQPYTAVYFWERVG